MERRAAVGRRGQHVEPQGTNRGANLLAKRRDRINPIALRFELVPKIAGAPFLQSVDVCVPRQDGAIAEFDGTL
jgi:hypothetical protein